MVKPCKTMRYEVKSMVKPCAQPSGQNFKFSINDMSHERPEYEVDVSYSNMHFFGIKWIQNALRQRPLT